MRIQETDEEDKEKYHDLHECDPSHAFGNYRPGEDKDQLYVEDEEYQCELIVAYVQLDPGFAPGGNTTLVGFRLLWILGRLGNEAG